MYILGISAFYHDSAAALICDGKIIAAVQEERFSRIKNDSSFPKSSIKFCLEYANITLNEIDKIMFYDDSVLKFKRILDTYKTYFPKSIPFIFKSLPIWLTKKLFWKKNLIDEFYKNFGVLIDKNIISNTTHHASHAASAFFPSPFDRAAILVIDGVGEFETVSLWTGKNSKLHKIESINFPHSLGLLYSAFTYYLGFKVNSGEYKVMGLAPYGEPKYVDMIKKYLINIDKEGNFTLNMDYFNYHIGNTMTNDKFHKLFGKEPRRPEAKLTQFEMDMASSIQKIAEEVMIKLVKKIKTKTNLDNLCLAGGVALNCVANGKILKLNIFKNIWIQPAAGDAGGSLGAALYCYYHILNNKRDVTYPDKMQGSYLGPEFEDDTIKQYLDKFHFKYKSYDFDSLVDKVVELLINKKVVGWYQGRMEFGPRALGNRSIIADPRDPNMQKILNLKIKYRESFRPFAPSILKEEVNKWFELDMDSPYMLIVADVKKERQISMTDEQKKLFGIEKLSIPRSQIPAVTHVDYSARIQTVDKDINPKYYKLIEKFYKKTDCPILVNTSFNVRGEPIVCTPKDSLTCFLNTKMDALAIGNFLLLKDEQDFSKIDLDAKRGFELD